jgi:pimeloyl-ACP methyl ester carboxylesterase
MPVEIEPIVGRYMALDIDGRRQRIYFEEAGEGIPLVCLHTAGADGRQWRHLLTDAEVTKSFRVIAFDMPWHGKSNPPEGHEKEAYRLTAKGYVNTIRAVIAALDLKKPVAMGCSIGGHIMLHLSRYHAADFKALIGVQCSDHHRPWYDSTWMHRPDVHGGEISAAIVSGMMAPQSPRVSVQETLWYYKQSGPGVFRGDLWFYGAEGDFRAEAEKIDTSQCPFFILTGEYDYSCTPEDSKATASRVRGAQFQVMEELGHFPMSENPAQFRSYLMPVLEKIKAI